MWRHSGSLTGAPAPDETAAAEEIQMPKSQQAQDSSERMIAGAKTAVLLLAFGLMAIIGEFALFATHQNAWPEAPVDAATAVKGDSTLPSVPGVEMPMIAWDRAAGIASAEASTTPNLAWKSRPANDPSVPSADSVGPLRQYELPPTN
jgi:hypothetical protein